jgi:N-acetylneuraminic acid mutarotase
MRIMKPTLEFREAKTAESPQPRNQHTRKLPACLMRWVAIAGTAAALLAIGVDRAGATILASNGFNSASVPAGWASEVVANAGGSPAITFVTSSTSPTASPSEGSYFVKFNSYSCYSGCQVRLKQTTSFSTIGYNPVTVKFAWFQDTGYSSYTSEGVTVQWSTNGTSWNNGNFYQRYNNVSNGWRGMQYSLPLAAVNQSAVYIAFLFNSQYGNNCYLDNVLADGILSTGITNVTPSTGPISGGNVVTITGNSMGNGDVTNVTLCGIAATILSDLSPTQIVVSAGMATVPANGNVAVYSTSCGMFVRNNAYTYLPPAPNTLAATNITLNSLYANWISVSGATNYLLDVSTTSNFTSCIAGYTNLSLGNVTTFRVNGLNAGTAYYYRLRCQQNGFSSDNSSTISLQTLSGGTSVSNGPAAGGTALTISGAGLGNGSDITNVTICGVMAVVQSQTANSVTVVVGAGGSGTWDIKVYSASRGVTTFVNSYTYNPPGAIYGPLTWLSVSNLPAARYGLAAASVNGKIYAIGGIGSGGYQSTVYVYDPAQPSLGWLSASNLPAARSSLAAASVNGKIYAFGGFDGYSDQSTVYVYDPAQPSLGWLSVSNLPAGCSALATASVNGRIYAIQSTVSVYDPAQSALGWLSASNLPAGRSALAAASVNGKIYAIGGNGSGGYQSTVYVYDPPQPSLGWLSASNLPAGRSGLAAASVNGNIYAIGGHDGTNYQSTVYVYNPAQPTLGWLGVSNLPAARYSLAAASANGKIYAIGGYTNGYQSTVYEGSFAAGVVPSSGPLTGSNTVTISGNNLGNGDVTSVTLCGIPATILADYSPGQVVVTAGIAIHPTNGDVVVCSTSYGVTVKSNAYSYQPPPPNALAATNVALNGFYANWNSVSVATNYLLDVSTTNNFTSCVAGYTNLSVGNVTTFRVSGLNAGVPYYYRVRYQQNNVNSENSATVSVQTLGGGTSVSNGPSAGGNTLTISGTGLGNGSDITNVTICGVVAVIQSQTANSVTVVVGAGGSGTGNIQIYSASDGVTTFVNGYTYNQQGAILGPFTGWLSVSNLPAARMGLAAASVNGKIYAIGGYNGSDTSYSTVYVYDPTQPTLGWLSASNLPAPRGYLAAASVNGKIYAIGGYYPGFYSSTVYVYDPAQPTLGWLSVSNLPGSLDSLVATSVNGKIYAISGSSTGVFVYDPTQPTLGWLSVSNLPNWRYAVAGTSVNGKIYVIGGWGGPEGSDTKSTVYVYDTTQPTLGWLSASNLPAAREYLGAVSENGKICAIGGFSQSSSSFQSTVYVYDPAQPTVGWLSTSNLPVACDDLAVASVNGTIYAIGGWNGSPMSTVYKGSFAPDVVPSLGQLSGGNTVTINGRNLGNSDITSVTLCGIPATVLMDNSPTQVVVSAGTAAIPVNGNVVVCSTSCGVTVKSNAYTYQQFPTITTSNSLPSGILGMAYNQALTASGGVTPYTWSITSGSLPPGLNLSIDGVISGTPTLATTGSFTAQVTGNDGLFSTKAFTLTIIAGPPTITTSSPLPVAAVGFDYYQPFTASGGATPYTWSITSGSLPPDLNLSTDGVISGTPTLATNVSFIVQVTGNDGLSSSNVFGLTTALMIKAALAGTHNLQLAWPTNCLGWELQVQTNPPGTGIGTNWFPVATSTTTNQLLILINAANSSVFYRLHQR